jgi:CubicO group peptidase (beta-lactamase class C family)
MGLFYYATSTGKGAAATVANVLVDRGTLDYDQSIADVWPEFGAHGKDKATRADAGSASAIEIGSLVAKALC